MMKILVPCLLALACFFCAPAQEAAAQKRYNLVGNWKADVFEFGQSVSIYWSIYKDGSTAYNFVWPTGQSGWLAGSWADEDDVVYECWSDGECGAGHIAWVSPDCFVLTILHNQQSPVMDGWKRVYYRLPTP